MAGFAINSWLKREFFIRTLRSPFGVGLLSSIALLMAGLCFSGYYMIAILFSGVLAGAIIFYYCLFKPHTGFYIVTFIAFFAFYPTHLLNRDVPLGTFVEILTWVVLLGSIREKPPGEIKNSLLQSGISIAFIIYTSYHVVEFFNPNMLSRSGYFFVMRKFIMFIFIYIMGYRLINTPERFRFFLKFWLVMSFITALYGCYQQWFGYLPAELRYIKSNPTEYKLMYQGGQLRIYSFLSDVVSFGVLCGTMSVIAVILAISEKRKKIKYGLYFMAAIMFLGMSYSGTRTTTIILPVGISLYLIMTIKNKTTLLTLFATILAFLFILYAPIYNKTIQRMRSTFDKDNASLEVRNANRHFIQPYIYSHPMGGGLATAGVAGRKYNPGHPLAGFPPDSGFLQMAMEIGWIGFGLTILFYLMILYQNIYYYFRIRNPEFKLYVVAIVSCLLSNMVTQYSQVSIGQIPGVFFFFSAIAITKRLMEFDNAEYE